VAGALLLLLPASGLILNFALGQVRWASALDTSPLDWMWQNLVGPAPAGPFFSAVWWLSWSTGVGGLNWLPGPGLHVAGGLVVVAAAAAGFGGVIRLGRSRPHVLFLAVMAAAAVATVLICVARGQWWVAAKGLSYGAMVGLPLLLAPVAWRRFRVASLPAWGLLAAHLGFGVMRIGSSADADGIFHRGWVYPAVMDPVLKTARVWAVGDAREALRASRGLKIDVPDMWLENYALVIANASGVGYFKMSPVTNVWRFTDRSLGLQPFIPDFDTLAYIEYDFARGRAGLGLARRDGRVYSARPGRRLTWIDPGTPLDTQGGLLTWSMGPAAAVRSTRLLIEADQPGPGQLRLGVGAPPELQGHVWLRFAHAGESPRIAAVRPMGFGSVQSVNVPLTLTAGKNVIEILLQTDADSVNSPATLTLINPLVAPGP
jgi:hypothetical protein